MWAALATRLLETSHTHTHTHPKIGIKGEMAALKITTALHHTQFSVSNAGTPLSHSQKGKAA